MNFRRFLTNDWWIVASKCWFDSSSWDNKDFKLSFECFSDEWNVLNNCSLFFNHRSCVRWHFRASFASNQFEFISSTSRWFESFSRSCLNCRDNDRWEQCDENEHRDALWASSSMIKNFDWSEDANWSIIDFRHTEFSRFLFISRDRSSAKSLRNKFFVKQQKINVSFRSNTNSQTRRTHRDKWDRELRESNEIDS